MIPITRPMMDEREAEAARKVILGGWITQGPEVAAFEREFANFVGAPHACAVSSCTTALHLALLAAGVMPGDAVATVSHSYIATANAVRYCGAEPVFVDIEPESSNMDPALLEAAIGPRTRAILCVHQMGTPCDLAAIVDIARRHGLPVVEDAACAIGSEILWRGRWETIGAPHGDIACFSFHPRKVMSTGDGGMITTRHEAWDRRCRLMRQHGMSMTDTVRHGSASVVFEQHDVLGFNYRMTDIQAAIGRVQLTRMPGILARRRELAARYGELLSDIPGLEVPSEPEGVRSNWQSYSVRLTPGRDQRALMQTLLDAGIATRRGVMCAHREAPYVGAGRVPLPCSEAAQDQRIILPLYPQMTDADQRQVADALKLACAA